MALSGWEAFFFWVFAFAALIAGLLTILARNAVHSALFLISSLVSVAALFILLGAEFIAGVQILVYVGGVMVLFLFVIMLVNVSAEERGRELLFNSPSQVIATLVFSLLLAIGLAVTIKSGAESLYKRDQSLFAVAAQKRAAEQQGMSLGATRTTRLTLDTENVGGGLYRYGSLPFEIASLLLLVAIIGSVMLARTIKQEAASDDLDPERLKEELPAEAERAELESVSQ